MTLRTRVILVVLTALLFGGLAYPSFFPQDVREASAWIADEGLNLGLDLQGGMHWLLRIDEATVIEQEQKRNLGLVERALDRRDLEGEVSLSEADVIEVRGVDEARLSEIVDEDFLPLDVGAENGYVALRLSDESIAAVVDRGVDQAIEVLQTRIDRLGVREPHISAEGRGRVLVQMPGEIDPTRARSIITETTFLQFKRVLDSAANTELLEAKYEPRGLPENTEIVASIDDDGVETEAFLVPTEAVLTGDRLRDARLAFDRTQPVVSFEWDVEGTAIFRDFTAEAIGERMAAIIDEKVITAPVIRSRIGRWGQIEGRFREQEAADLALKLRSGALPVPLVIEEERSVGPALGADSVRNGVYSILIGGIAVVAFMAVYYSLSGALANAALLLNIVIIIGLMSFAQATLTLPGIAGLVLTVGMAVDANVIIFERVREELRGGKSIRNAVQIGFNRSRLTILDANITTMIAAVVLLYLGRGPVQGFGTTLAIGIFSSVFCALFVTRLLVDLVVSRGVERLRI